MAMTTRLGDVAAKGMGEVRNVGNVVQAASGDPDGAAHSAPVRGIEDVHDRLGSGANKDQIDLQPWERELIVTGQDFISVRALVAGKYEVLIEPEHAARAHELLRGMTG
ncbi:hypothetical protein [Nonomuraea zeae]|uniref:hypothetical protein n=1 Tax=Nonomuraea zeae TaxID=1642303 RepID=UPI0036D3BB1A